MPRLGNQKWFLPRYDGLLAFGCASAFGFGGLGLGRSLGLGRCLGLGRSLGLGRCVGGALRGALGSPLGAGDAHVVERDVERLEGAARGEDRPGGDVEGLQRDRLAGGLHVGGLGRTGRGDGSDEERLGDDEPRQAGGQAHRESAAGGSRIHAARLAAARRQVAGPVVRAPWDGRAGPVVRTLWDSAWPASVGRGALRSGRPRSGAVGCRRPLVPRAQDPMHLGTPAGPIRDVERDPGGGVRERQSSAVGCGSRRRRSGCHRSPRPRSGRAPGLLAAPASNRRRMPDTG